MSDVLQDASASHGWEFDMAVPEYRPGVPDNWFVDPVRLGVPGVRGVAEEDDPLAWQSDALCAQTDPEAFFPEKGGSTRDAKKICASCEVRAQCLEYALANDERFGIWGGLSERERRKLRKRAS
jgi:WhiB family redox-sensing transcriptional regulator